MLWRASVEQGGEGRARASAPIFSLRRPGPHDATASSALGSTTPKGARSTSCTAAPRTAEGVQSAGMGETSAQAAAFADVHKLAAEAGLIEADIEKFLDDSLIGDINSAADAEELEASMLERRDQRAAKARVAERAAELLAAELVGFTLTRAWPAEV